MLGLDLLCLWAANKIWPDEKAKQQRLGAEESANWIILDDQNSRISKEDWSNNIDHQTHEAPHDIPIDADGDFYGPEW